MEVANWVWSNRAYWNDNASARLANYLLPNDYDGSLLDHFRSLESGREVAHEKPVPASDEKPLLLPSAHYYTVAQDRVIVGGNSGC